MFSIRLNEVLCTPRLVTLVLRFGGYVSMLSIRPHAWVAYCLPYMGGCDLEQKVLINVWLVTLTINVWLVTLYGWIDWDV